MIATVYRIVDEVRRQVAPDARTEVFDVTAEMDGHNLLLTGYATTSGGVSVLVSRLGDELRDVAIRNEVVCLDSTRHPAATAIITAAAAPVLAGPLISESPLSQAPMGHTVSILRSFGRWFQCRMGDGNIGWIHRGYLRQIEMDELRAWEDDAAAPLHVSIESTVLASDGCVLVRLPTGARVGRNGDTAHLPDGRRGRIEGKTIPVAELPRRFPATGAAVVSTARSWTGCPYLWGGVTPWGADCSGLVQAVFRLHGIELPRDSDQQAKVGERVSTNGDLAGVEAGDLIFFAERDDRISHVGISTGGPKMIHSALGNGGVAENDLAAGTAYDRELRSCYVETRRIIPRGS